MASEDMGRTPGTPDERRRRVADPDPAALVATWSILPEPVRAAVRAPAGAGGA